ncbi:hypothetical protein GCM10010919_04150 [Alishewanella longhuensis]|uniref:Histidine kinase domain-containing protein n=1 Tax=Alishewanella longhuensis TaxID=1091037 RepID=A0ABQ3KVC9_9ALTE|nr:histidine kinase [Alishewanella longhuensis]GHG60579.1 hypothetical protein GCM10010919_04150 [Alishewanella longhuensis]
MPFISLGTLLRFNLYYWFAIFMLVLLSSWQLAALSDRPFPTSFLTIMLASKLVAMLLTTILVYLTYTRLTQTGLSHWQLLLGVSLLAALHIPLENASWMWFRGREIVDFRQLMSNMDTSILAFFVWTACYLSLLLYQQQMHRLRQNAELSKKIQQLELQALSQQLNPHFTFNALNSVCALLEAERYDAAETMSEQLASFLRYSLSKSPDCLVQLADELAAINDYLQLQKTRFGDKLKVNWHIDKALQQQPIPALLLQPLVENAIKYAVATRKQGATITISGVRDNDNLQLSVSDDGPGSQLALDTSGAGVGLDNTRNRLAQHFGDKAQLKIANSPSGFRVDICLPWQLS